MAKRNPTPVDSEWETVSGGDNEWETLSAPPPPVSPMSVLGQGGMAGPIPRAKLASALATAQGYPGPLPAHVPAANYYGWRPPAGEDDLRQDIRDFYAGQVEKIKQLLQAPFTPPPQIGPEELKDVTLRYQDPFNPVPALRQGIATAGANPARAAGGALPDVAVVSALGKAGERTAPGGEWSPEGFAARAAVKAGTKHEAAVREITSIARPSPNDPNFEATLQVTLPRIVQAVEGRTDVGPKGRVVITPGGRAVIQSPADLHAAASEALRQQVSRVRSQYIRPVADQIVDTTPIAQQMQAQITSRFAEMEPGAAETIARRASNYAGRNLSMGEVYKRYLEVNRELNRLYEASPVKQRITMQDPSNGYLVAEQSGLRDILYQNLPAEAVNEIRMQGAIGEVKDVMLRAKINAARELRGEPLLMTPGEAGEIAVGAGTGRVHIAAIGGARMGARFLRGKAPTMNERFARAWKDLQISEPRYSTVNPQLPPPPAYLTPNPLQLPAPSPESAAANLEGFIQSGIRTTRGRPKLLPAASPEPTVPRNVALPSQNNPSFYRQEPGTTTGSTPWVPPPVQMGAGAIQMPPPVVPVYPPLLESGAGRPSGIVPMFAPEIPPPPLEPMAPPVITSPAETPMRVVPARRGVYYDWKRGGVRRYYTAEPTEDIVELTRSMSPAAREAFLRERMAASKENLMRLQRMIDRAKRAGGGESERQ